MSRVGQVFAAARWVYVVVSQLDRDQAIFKYRDRSEAAAQSVYVGMVILESGVRHSVQRFEVTLASWEADGLRLL